MNSARGNRSYDKGQQSGGGEQKGTAEDRGPVLESYRDPGGAAGALHAPQVVGQQTQKTRSRENPSGKTADQTRHPGPLAWTQAEPARQAQRGQAEQQRDAQQHHQSSRFHLQRRRLLEDGGGGASAAIAAAIATAKHVRPVRQGGGGATSH